MKPGSAEDNIINNSEKTFPPFRVEKDKIISLLQKVQARHRYISEEAILKIARDTSASKNYVYGVASFYAQFRFTPPGKHIIKVCLGTACHVQGGESLLESLERQLDVQPDGITKDGIFSLEKVACFGCCSLSPVLVVDNTVYGRMNNAKMKSILDEYIQPKPQIIGVQPLAESNVTWRWNSYAHPYAIKST